jgi:hypothetical protein
MSRFCATADGFLQKHRGSHNWLFFGDDAIFPFSRGPPPQSEPSPLCQFIANEYWTLPDDDWKEQYRPHWISLEALCVDLWNDPSVILVSSRVPAKFVKHFGRGQETFPEASLLAAGCTESDLYEWWRCARAADKPVDTVYGVRLPSDIEPDRPTLVTWTASVRVLLGDETAADFIALKEFGSGSEVRIIALWR